MVRALQQTTSVWRILWRWEVIGVVAPALYGFGVAAMYGDNYRIAIALYFIAVILLMTKILSWEEIRKQVRSKKVLMVILVAAMGAASLWVSLKWIQLRKRDREATQSTPVRTGPQAGPTIVSPPPSSTLRPTNERPIKPAAAPKQSPRSGTQPQSLTISAPNGIPIGGGTVTNPIVNNYAPSQRTQTDAQKTGFADFANGLPAPMKITVATIDGQPEAEKYAAQFQEVLIAYSREGSQTVLTTLGWSKGTPTGLWVDTHSDEDSAVTYRELLIKKMESLGLEAVPGHSSWVPQGGLYIIVGVQQ